MQQMVLHPQARAARHTAVRAFHSGRATAVLRELRESRPSLVVYLDLGL
jgi:hypothetical protein